MTDPLCWMAASNFTPLYCRASFNGGMTIPALIRSETFMPIVWGVLRFSDLSSDVPEFNSRGGGETWGPKYLLMEMFEVAQQLLENQLKCLLALKTL